MGGLRNQGLRKLGYQKIRIAQYWKPVIRANCKAKKMKK